MATAALALSSATSATLNSERFLLETPPTSSESNPNTALKKQVTQALGLADADFIQVNLNGAPGKESRAFISTNTNTFELILTPNSPYAEGFQLLEDRGDGELVSVTPPTRTYFPRHGARIARQHCFCFLA